MVQLSGRGASSWFMVPTLQGGATGARWLFPAPGSMLPHWGGLKWEKVSNSNCRKARKSQGMTLEGKPSTTTATTLKPLLLQADEALTWADLCPLSPSSRLLLQIQRLQDKPNLEHQEHLNPLLPVARVYSALARKSPECTVFFQTKEQSAAMHNTDKSM